MDSFSDNRKSKTCPELGRRTEYPKWGWGFTIVFALGLFGEVALAQQGRTMPLIGYLAGAGSSPNQAFMQGMRDLGYVEGKNIAFAYRTTEGRSERYAELAAELVSLKVDIIIADGTGPGLAAKKATSTIPIVLATGADPVGNGLVASLARPGGNVTGLTNLSPELGGKLLELLKEVVPKLSRVAVLMLRGLESPANHLFVKETEPSARKMGIQLIPLAVRGPEDFEEAFRSTVKQRANGFIDRIGPGGSTTTYQQAVGLTIKNRLPAISGSRRWVDRGGLMYYGGDDSVRYRRVAAYVDKILKGTKPADLPVEAPMKFELVINLKTAKQIGVTIPPDLLARATRIIR
jgi:putative tryptophan/tyrosine transport system substrate-binding protein